MALLGGVAGPALLVYGLERTDAVRASLLLTLEAPLTALLAAALFREYVSGRVWLAVTFITMGAAALAFPALAHGGQSRSDDRRALRRPGVPLLGARQQHLAQAG